MKQKTLVVLCVITFMAAFQSCMIEYPYYSNFQQYSYQRPYSQYGYTYQPQQVPDFGGNWNPYINGYQNQNYFQNTTYWGGATPQLSYGTNLLIQNLMGVIIPPVRPNWQYLNNNHYYYSPNYQRSYQRKRCR